MITHNSINKEPTTEQRSLAKAVVWRHLFTLTIMAAYFYVFMEWVFFVTKPSFMSVMNSARKVEIFLLSGLVLSVASLILLIICAGLDFLLSFLRQTRVFVFVGALIPAGILTALSLLAIDNFTYTILKFGIVSTSGLWRGVYALLGVFLFWRIYRWALGSLGLRGETQNQDQLYSKLFILSVSLFVFSSVLALTRSILFVNNDTWTDSGILDERPNILILGSDGVNAQHMSAYGYERDTTPNIQELAEVSLLAENAFPNAGNSTGSVISMMTSKSPVQTGVVFPPNILTGVDAFQHLPGILQRKGYHTVEIAMPHYVDAYNANLRNGFDIVNQRSSNDEVPMFRFVRRLGQDNVVYFISKLTGRIGDRSKHIFYIQEMENPFDMVIQPAENISDREMIDQLLDLFLQSDDPLFVHVHMMGTHGAKFNPRQQVFSVGQAQDQPWMTDFYDDAILDYDTYVGEVVDRLFKAGILDNTIVVIYTDHGMTYTTNVRLPLIMHFPGNQYAGRINNNAQNLDVAPTILDYLGLPQPKWMEGQSLLQGEPPAQRLIFSTGAAFRKEESEGLFILDAGQIKPPFYQFGYISILACQKWYRINLITLEWDSGDITGHTSPCDEDSLLSIEQIRTELLNHLSANGFDISSIPENVFSTPTP